MQCPNCGRVLGAEEITGDACQYCGAVLPHVARAYEKAALAKQILADADGDGIPDIVQQLVHGGAASGGKVQVNVNTPGAGGSEVALPDDVRVELEARGIDLSNAVVMSTTTTTTTSSEVPPAQAENILAQLGAMGTQPASAPASPPAGFAIGSRVLVQWSDGKRYPAQLVEARPGEYRVAFPDGRTMWVGEAYVSAG